VDRPLKCNAPLTVDCNAMCEVRWSHCLSQDIFGSAPPSDRPPLWSSDRFPVLPDFLSSSGSRTGSTQPREDKRELLDRKKIAVSV
jgi:hypothetical protein